MLNNSIYVFRISSEAVVIEAVADHEVVGYLLAAVLYVELHLQLAWFEQERTDVDALGVLTLERVEHVSHREASIDDVFDDNDGPSCDVDVKPNHFANAARRVRALIGSQLDEGNLARQVNLAQEVGSKDKRAVEDSEEDRLATCEVAIDLLCDTLYLSFYGSFGNGYGEGFVLHLDDFIFLHKNRYVTSGLVVSTKRCFGREAKCF